jgi:hypothetical protein
MALRTFGGEPTSRTDQMLLLAIGGSVLLLTALLWLYPEATLVLLFETGFFLLLSAVFLSLLVILGVRALRRDVRMLWFVIASILYMGLWVWNLPEIEFMNRGRIPFFFILYSVALSGASIAFAVAMLLRNRD